MPNWCNNSIRIFGEKENIKKIKDILNNISYEEEETFRQLIGRSLPELSEKEWSNGKWYEGNIEHLGCKWDIPFNDVSLDIWENEIYMSFSSAWSPFIPACQKISSKFDVDVEIEYDENGCDFAGRYYIGNKGDIIERQDYSYMEGIYILRGIDDFLEEVVQYYIDDLLVDEDDNRVSLEKINEMFDFIDNAEDIESIFDYCESFNCN